VPAVRQNLAEALVGVGASRYPDRVALREPTRAWTYGELHTSVTKVGGALKALGIRPGDRVAVLMRDGLEAAASLLGAIHVGAIAVPLSELWRPNDIRALVRDSGAVVAIVHASLEPFLDEVRGEMASLREVVVLGRARGRERDFQDLVASAQPASPADSQAGDLALLLYSSGDIREGPCGVPHTHAAPLLSFQHYAQGVLGITEDDRIFSAVKLATAYGLSSGLVYPLAAGGEALLLPEQPRSRPVFDMLDTKRATVLFATPSLYGQLLVDAESENLAISLPALRACVAGGEALSAGLHARLKSRLGMDVLCGYNLTEGFNFVLSNRPGAVRAGSSGAVIPGFAARVVGEDGDPLGANEIGTLEFRGPSVAREYWDHPQETSHTFRGDWVRSGDRYLCDEDGYFFHCGRADDRFKVGGKWVAPLEVEATLLSHEAVWECAVVGVEDENDLIKPLAFVVPNVGHAPGSALETELIAHVKREIAPYKYPRWIEFVDALPRGPHGKLLRYKLSPKVRRRRDA
jgi:benzoate-CoA ligase family protein